MSIAFEPTCVCRGTDADIGHKNTKTIKKTRRLLAKNIKVLHTAEEMFPVYYNRICESFRVSNQVGFSNVDSLRQRASTGASFYSCRPPFYKKYGMYELFLLSCVGPHEAKKLQLGGGKAAV